MKYIPIVVVIFLCGCAQMFSASSEEISHGKHRVVAIGNMFASLQELSDKIEKKAVQLCPGGFSYTNEGGLVIDTQELELNGVQTSGTSQILNRFIVCNEPET